MPGEDKRTQMNYTVLIITLGCKVNQYDSGVIYGSFRQRGFQQYMSTPAPGAARSGPDIVIVNTCIVSAESERKSRQAIRRMRAKYPSALLAVAGCYPQRFPSQVSEIAGVDFISGISGREALVEWAVARMSDNRSNYRSNQEAQSGETCSASKAAAPPPNAPTVSPRVLTVSPFVPAAPPQYIPGSGGRTRSYVKIQDGCNNFCSYCIVSYTRGRARSRDLYEILNEVDFAASGGAPEIVLTGINISSYSGSKYSDTTNVDNTDGGAACDTIDLGGLIDTVSKRLRSREKFMRLRLSSLEPTAVTPGFVKILSDNRDVLCPHFHLSLQSGSETVLRRMNRAYTPAEYIEVVSMLRSEFPEAGLTTDVITGFPGESEDEFQETYDLCRRIAFSKIHVFPYSKRPGTRAADLPDHISPQKKRERTRRLIELSDELSLAFHRSHMGKDIRVLVESVTDKYAEGITGNYIKARAQLTDSLPQCVARRGEYIAVRVTDASPSRVNGIIV